MQSGVQEPSVGVEKPSLPSWSKMPNVGKAGSVTSAITLLQIVPIIFTPSKHLSNYGYDIGTMHPDVQTMMLMIIPIWGLMGLAAVLMRLSIIVVGDKASMMICEMKLARSRSIASSSSSSIPTLPAMIRGGRSRKTRPSVSHYRTRGARRATAGSWVVNSTARLDRRP